MQPSGPFFSAAMTVVVAVLCAAPAAAQPADYEDFAGVWHEDDWRSIEIGPNTVTQVTPNGRWEADATTCTAAFEHQFTTRTRADLVEFLGLDNTDPYSQLTDDDGAPMGDRILAAWPAGDGPVKTLWSYCAAETHGGSLFFLTGDGQLSAIRYGDGIAEIAHYSRDVPAPSHDTLSDFEKRQVQAELQQRSFYGGAIDGLFGPGTEAAIRAYQQSIGAEATGILTRAQVQTLLYGG